MVILFTAFDHILEPLEVGVISTKSNNNIVVYTVLAGNVLVSGGFAVRGNSVGSNGNTSFVDNSQNGGAGDGWVPEINE